MSGKVIRKIVRGKLFSPSAAWEHSLKVLHVVYQVYRKFHQTLGDDRQLVIRVWQYYGVKIRQTRYGGYALLFQDFEHIRRIPNPDDITRRGRELRAEDKRLRAAGLPPILPATSEYVDRKRERMEGMHHTYHSGQDPTTLNDF